VQNNTIKKGFREAYDELPYKNRETVQVEIMKKLHISLSTFNNKKAGRTSTRQIEVPIIRSVFRKYGVEMN